MHLIIRVPVGGSEGLADILGRVGGAYRMEKNGSQATKEEVTKKNQFTIYQQQVWPEHQTAWGWSQKQPLLPTPSTPAKVAGTKSSQSTFSHQSTPRTGKSTCRGLKMSPAPSSQYLGKKPCFPEAPQDFSPQPQMGLQSCSLLTWHLKVHTEIMCRKERSH